MVKQNTLSKEITLEGIGLHTGKQVKMVLKPAPVDNGFTFVRTDLEGCPVVEADATYVSSTERGTVLEKKGDAYKSAGIDLRNEKEVDKHFIIRVTNTSGEVLKVKSKTTKNGLGLISLEKTTSSTPGIFEEEADVKTEEGTKYKIKTTATTTA